MNNEQNEHSFVLNIYVTKSYRMQIFIAKYMTLVVHHLPLPQISISRAHTRSLRVHYEAPTRKVVSKSTQCSTKSFLKLWQKIHFG